MKSSAALGHTPAKPVSLARQVDAEPIPGYRLVEMLGKGGYGEVWKCEAPGGFYKAIKFVYGDMSSLEDVAAPAEQELQAIERIKPIRHPFLLSVERVEIINHHLVIVTELADKNLMEVRAEYQKGGDPGIPKPELLAFLREAAEALDWMNIQFGLQHLDIKPQNLFLVSNHVKVADFGLVTSLWETSGTSNLMAGTTPPYSAPEVFRGAISPYSDQYSLAIVYQELLTGFRPFNGKNARHFAMQHDQAEPDLAALPLADRPVVARALAKDPRQRFPTCTALIEALISAQSPSFIPPGKAHKKGRANRTQALPPLANEPETSLRSSNGGTEEEAAPVAGEFRNGLEFLACLDHSPLCEVWKVQTLEGRERAAKFVHSFARSYPRAEAEAVSRLTMLNHPNLTRVEVTKHWNGCVLLLTDLPGKTLLERLQESRLQGLPALPRWEMVRYLKSAALALDYLWEKHGILHLGLNPGNLHCSEDRLLVADAGLMHLLWLPAGHSPFQINPLYSAPELFDKKTHPSCDQYSLAIIYLEMMIGQQPHLGLTPRQLAKVRREGKLDLSQLSEADQIILARALHPDPEQRYDKCVDFANALEAGAGGERALVRGLPPVVCSTWSGLPAGLSGPVPAPETIITELLAAASSESPSRPSAPILTQAGEVLQGQLTLERDTADLQDRLERFRSSWQALVVCRDSELFLCQVWLPRGFLRRYLGKPTGLEIQVHFQSPVAGSQGPIEVLIQIKPLGCTGQRAEDLIKEFGPVLMRSLGDHLQSHSEQRGRERIQCFRTLRVHPVLHNFQLGQAIECRAKDVSLTGVGFLSPIELPTPQVYVDARRNSQQGLQAVLAQITRNRPRDDGWFDVGAFFSLDG